MNERIRELADQAELTIRTSKGTYMSHPEFNKKFAELIVRECAHQLDDGAEDGMWARGVLYRHFGVEE